MKRIVLRLQGIVPNVPKHASPQVLEDIAGVGAKRRKALLTRFGGLDAIKNASMDEIAQVEGVGKDLAEKIYGEFH